MIKGHSEYIKTTVVCPYYISTGMFAGVQVGRVRAEPEVQFNKSLSLQSKLIPILEPPFVADQVVSAVLREREVLLLPWWSFLLIALKVKCKTINLLREIRPTFPQAVMTEPAFMRLSQAFGFNCSMDQFQGRQKKD